MSNAPNVPSSDLSRAAALSLGLSSRRASSPEAPVTPSRRDGDVAYTRLRARVVPPPSPASPDAFGASAWNDLLDWALATAASRAAFVVDRHGLVVAFRGAITRDAVEALGSSVAGLVDAAARVEGPDETRARALCLDVGTSMISVALAQSGLALCVVGHRDLSRETREALIAALARAGG